MNLIFADGELCNGWETTACTKTDSPSAMVTQEQVRQATTCKVFLHDCAFDLSNSSQNVNDCYFCLLYNSSCVTAFTTTLCFYYSVVNPRTLEGLLFAVSHMLILLIVHIFPFG